MSLKGEDRPYTYVHGFTWAVYDQGFFFFQVSVFIFSLFTRSLPLEQAVFLFCFICLALELLNMENEYYLSGNNSLHERTVQSMEEAFQALYECPRDEVYPLAMQMQSELTGLAEYKEDCLFRLHEFVSRGEFWRGHESDLESFQYNWRAARDAIANRTKRLEYIDSIREKSIKTWGRDNAKALFLRVKTRAMAEKVSKLLSSNLDYYSIRLMINNEIVNRLSTKSRGIKRDKAIMQGDIAKAFSNRCRKPLSIARLNGLGLEIDDDGYCCPAGSGKPSTLAHDFDFDLESHANPSNSFVPSTVQEPLQELSYETSREPSQEPMLKLDSRCRNKNKRKRKRKDPAQCGCLLSASTLRRIFRRTDLRMRCQKALQKFGHKLHKRSLKIDPSTTCPSHSRQLSNILGMSSHITHKERTNRLDNLYHSLNRYSWEDSRTRYSDWFRQSKPAATPIDMFRFRENRIRPLVEDWSNLEYLTFEGLYRRCFGKTPIPALKKTDNFMEHKGSVIIPGVFGWLKHDLDGKHPGGILKLAQQEFAMYDWHFRFHKDHPRHGWAKNMWYSLIQQLVRQDIVYWMWHVYFRPDHLWRLISVPHYCQSTYPGESLYLQQPDTHIRASWNSGHGKNFLQGSVSFDDEDEQNCDELLLGMNNHLESWLEDVSSRIIPSDDNEQEGFSEMWTSEDVEKYGIDWVKQVCHATDARFSLPDLPLRSKISTKARRRTVSACFVGISEGHSDIDIAELGTWEELSRSHRDFTSAEHLLENQVDDAADNESPFVFPGTLRLCGLGAVSDALVGRAKWNNTETIQGVNLLFGQDEKVAWKYIEDWRQNTFTKYITTFDRMVQVEKATYEENSFFNRLEVGLSTWPAFMEGIGFDNERVI